MNRVQPAQMEQRGDRTNAEQRKYFRSVSADVLGVEAGAEDEAGVDGAGAAESGGGRRRTWTMRNNAARQMAVNFMPSRQYGSLRLTRDQADELELLQRAQDAPEEEVQADVIVREMEQDRELMEDNPEAEELRREALRELPQCLTMKRTVRAKISASVSLKSKRRPVPFSKQLKYRTSFAIKRTRERFKDFFFSIELWYEAIRTVEGHFGSAAGTYFYFLRSLFLTDLALSVLLLCFVVVPQILHDERTSDGTDRAQSTSIFLDLLSGQGFLNDTVLFYGHYHNGTVAGSSYSLTFAYFFTMVSLYVFFFVLLSARTAWSYRRNFIETAGGLGHVYASKVFCGWDFGIATGAAAALNSRSLYNELKELLNEQNNKEITQTKCAKFGRALANLLVNILALALIGCILTLFWWLLEERAGEGSAAADDVLWPLTMAAIVTVVLTVCPLVFSWLVRLESYGPRVSLYVTLARTYVLDAATLLLLLVYWFRREVNCWETMLGQEIYRLIVLDMIFSVVLIPLFELVRGLIYMYCFPDLSLELDVAYGSLGLVWHQALLWLGLPFSPLLAPLATVKMFLTFYVRRGVALHVCRPARKVWRAAQTQTVLNLLQSLGLLGTLFVLGYFFLSSPSQQCGPFREYGSVWLVLTDGVLGLSERDGLKAVLQFFTRPGVIGFVLIAMCVLVYYMRARSHAQRSMVAILREMLVLEAKDKEFLLSAIAKVSNGEWTYSPKPEEPAASHTWRYLHDENVRKPSNSGYQLERAEPPRADAERPRAARGDSDSEFSWRAAAGRGGVTPIDGAQEKKWL